MKIYKTQKEIEKDIKDGVLAIDGDVKFECSFSIKASIVVNAGNINASNIDAWDITAGNIDAWDINAGNINAKNINAGNITAGNINARNINARDIDAGNIDAGNILYYAFCCVYNSIKCTSIKAERSVYKEPVCLDGEIEYKKKKKLKKN